MQYLKKLTSENFFHLPALGQFVYQLVQKPYLLSQGISNLFNSVATYKAL